MSELLLQPSALGPFLWVALGALGLVLVERVLSRRKSILGRPITDSYVATGLGLIAMACLVMACGLAASHFEVGIARSFQPSSPRMRLDAYSSLAFAWIAASAFLTCALSLEDLGKWRSHRGDYYALVLFATAGAFLVVSALDLVVLFLGIEWLGLALVALVGFDTRSARGHEAALKLLLMGGVSSAVLLYGMALLVAAAGATDFGSVGMAINQGSGIARFGIALVLAGFATKIAAVPFHSWVADVTQGAPRPVGAFVWIVAVAASVLGLLRFTTIALGEPDVRIGEVMRVLAWLSLGMGACLAWVSPSLLRMLAYLGVFHTGLLWIGFGVASDEASAAMLFQLVAQSAALFGAFTVLLALSHDGLDDRLDSLRGLARFRPGLSALLTLFVFSLAGFPGTAGFIARLNLFLIALRAGEAFAVVGAFAASALVLAAVIRIPVMMYAGNPPSEDRPSAPLASGEMLALALCAAIVVGLGVAPNQEMLGFDWPVLEWARLAVGVGLSD